jgi:hypothetical protein
MAAFTRVHFRLVLLIAVVFLLSLAGPCSHPSPVQAEDSAPMVKSRQHDLIFTAYPTSGLGPLEVNFINLTNGTVFDSFLWDFGDGSTSVEKDPVHTYTDPGNYTVSLAMSGPGGTDTETRPDYISVLRPVYLPVTMWTYKVYTRPGLYTFNRCQTFPVYIDGQKAANMRECVQSVEAQEDGNLKFIFTWRATYVDGWIYGCISKYSDLDNPNMYIANQNGKVSHFVEAGDAAEGVPCMGYNLVYTGWFRFPPATNSATVYTFYDLDNHITMPKLAIPLQ